jgi:serine phosphatase RsbU (regulator of sigma subunit)
MSALSQHLAQLEASGLIRLEQVEPDLEYRFHHKLLREAAYGSLLESERAEWHRAVGMALETLYPDRLASSELAPTLAHHFSQAGDQERALKYLARAGDAALARYANAEAEQHYRRALELAGLGSGRVELLSGLGLAYSRQSRFAEALQVWREAIVLCRSRGDTDGLARLYARSARAAWYGDVSQSLKLCQEGLDAVGDAQESPELARLFHEAARAHFFNGMPDRALHLCQESLRMAERLGAVDVQADALATMGMLYDAEPEIAVEALMRAIELAESNGLPYQASRAHTNLAYLLFSAMADFRTARDHNLRAAELSRQRGSVTAESLALGNAAHLSLLLGDFAEAEETLSHLRQLQNLVDDPGTVSTHILIGEAGLLRYHGALDEAARLLRICQSDARRQNNLENLSSASIDLAEVLLESAMPSREPQKPIDPRLEEAERALMEAIEISERAGWASVRARCLLSMARGMQGDLESTRQILAETRENAGPPPSRFDELWLDWAEGMMARAEANWTEALEAFERAAGAAAALGVRWWWAHGLQSWASVHTARGEPSDLERARALLQEAGTILRELNVPFYASLSERRLQAVQEQSYSMALDQQRATKELAMAGRIQEGLLPRDLPSLPGWDILATVEPARETSGDFYDFIKLPEGRLGIVVADVADKGAGAALYMALSRTLIRTFAQDYPSEPERVMSATNERILKDASETIFVTVFYGVLDPLTSTLTYCNAGHNPPFFLRGEADEVKELTRTGIALGVLDGFDWKQKTLQMAPGDALVLYTDGIPDARDSGGIMFGEERLLEVAQKAQGCTAWEVQEALLDEIHDFVGDAPRFDDITLMVLAMECAPEVVDWEKSETRA